MTRPGSDPQPATARAQHIILVRHGQSAANSAGVLAGRTPHVALSEQGQQQADSLVDRLGRVSIDGIISSPIQRCQETVAPLATSLGLPVEMAPALAEVEYGEWTNRKLSELSQEPLWAVVQHTPSLAVFPGGEALADMAARAWSLLRSLTVDQPGKTLLLCSHGDVIKSLLAHALGVHLDLFQRIVISPASLSVITFTAAKPYIQTVNNLGSLPAFPQVTVQTAVGGATGEQSET